jgi:hypothetical protein
MFMQNLHKVQCGKLGQVMPEAGILCLRQKSLASSWRETTIEGPWRTTHVEKRHVMASPRRSSSLQPAWWPTPLSPQPPALSPNKGSGFKGSGSRDSQVHKFRSCNPEPWTFIRTSGPRTQSAGLCRVRSGLNCRWSPRWIFRQARNLCVLVCRKIKDCRMKCTKMHVV